MGHEDVSNAELRKLIAQKKVTVVIGSGVSRATCTRAPSWQSLIESGIDRCQVLKQSKELCDHYRQLLKLGSSNLKSLIGVAEWVHDELTEQSEFGAWLRSQFEGWSNDKECPVIATLKKFEAPLVTTNYDDLIETETGFKSITWQDTAKAVRVVRRDSRNEVLHLHGHWDVPDSVVLGIRSYEAVKNHEHTQAVMKILGGATSLLFVGCGQAGLSDPNLGPFLDWLAKFDIDGKHEHKHFVLVSEKDRFERNGKAFPLVYGPTHDALADYLQSLLPDDKQTGDGTKSGTIPLLSHRTSKQPQVLPEIPSSYVDWLDELCRDVTPFNANPVDGLSVCLQQVYVPPQTSVVFEKLHPVESNERQDASRRSKSKSRKKPSQQADSAALQLHAAETGEQRQRPVLHALGERSLSLIGSPGSGKSTFTKWVALITAKGEIPAFRTPGQQEFEERLPDDLRGRLPVLVVLSEFHRYLPSASKQRTLSAKQLEEALRQWLNEKSPGGLSWDVVEAYLRDGKLLLIMDGVDEVPPSIGEGSALWWPRESLLTGIADLRKNWSPNNRLLVTSRPQGLDQTQVQALSRAEIEHAPLDDLPNELQDLLAKRWFAILPKFANQGDAVPLEMMERVRGHKSGIAEQIGNPLFLTAICILYGNGGELPQSKYELYQGVIKITLTHRYGKAWLEIERAREKLAALAWGMHTGKPYEPSRSAPAREVSIKEMDAILAGYIKETPKTARGFKKVQEERDELLSQSGLLTQPQPDVVKFFHLQMQEFLAAERMQTLQFNNVELVQTLVLYSESRFSNWRPTLESVFAGRLAPTNGTKQAVDLLLKLLDKIDNRGIGNAVGAALVAHDALHLMLDREADVPEDVLQRGRALALAAIKQGVEVKPRWELARLLMRLGDHRIPNDLRTAKIAPPKAMSRNALAAGQAPAASALPLTDNENDKDAGWVTVPAGTYIVGEGDKQKTHPIEQAFLISKYPVTNAQYAPFIADKGYQREDLWDPAGWKWRVENGIESPRSDLWQDPKWNGPTQPVVGVSWYEADAFCRWLTKLPQNPDIPQVVVPGARLPDEWDWEAAARGMERLEYPWGKWNSEEIARCNYDDAGIGVTNPVGMFPTGKSPCGAEEMGGNVWEWCDSWFNTNKQYRVLRGGSFNVLDRDTRAAVRNCSTPVNRNLNIGFRVCRCVRTL